MNERTAPKGMKWVAIAGAECLVWEDWTPKPPRKCIDCGRIHYDQKRKRCSACQDFIKAFTENKYGELA